MPETKGSVSLITTHRDGTTDVVVDRAEMFKHPDDLTDAQLAELKRAQDHGKEVTVKWTAKGGGKTVDSVTVHS